MKPIPLTCEFCLVVLSLGCKLRVPKLIAGQHKQLMKNHKPNCTHWNTQAAEVMGI